MDYLKIQGRRKLEGSVKISGAKNAALPLLALSILSKNEFEISNIPEVSDIKTFCLLLEMLGASIKSSKNYRSIDVKNINKTKATYDIIRKMRASILVLGPLLARFKQCEVSLPGGCAIGARPVDMHLKAIEKLGSDIRVENGYIIAKARKGLRGTDIIFDKITVTGTSNIVMAASLARGKTKIINAAKEPEVVQVCQVLKNSGLDISGIGSSEIEIQGTDGELINLVPTQVIPDRIEAGTYLCAGAITNSNIKVNGVNINHLESINAKLKEIGFDIKETKTDNDLSNIELISAKELKPFKITTQEYPGFPTDMQAQFMALSTQCNGASFVIEKLFENRFMHASELQRLGAKITIDGNVAQIYGKTNLIGADVMATDLRASSALIISALVAKGTTNIHRIYHLDRGYESLEHKLNQLGAKVERLKE